MLYRAPTWDGQRTCRVILVWIWYSSFHTLMCHESDLVVAVAVSSGGAWQRRLPKGRGLGREAASPDLAGRCTTPIALDLFWCAPKESTLILSLTRDRSLSDRHESDAVWHTDRVELSSIWDVSVTDTRPHCPLPSQNKTLFDCCTTVILLNSHPTGTHISYN